MAKLSTDDLIAGFKELSLIELTEFVKKFEEVFEVTAAAPVAVAARLDHRLLDLPMIPTFCFYPLPHTRTRTRTRR